MTPPTRYALVPVEATQRMCRALADDFEWDAARDSFQADYTAMLAASQNGGAVTAEMLERAVDAAADQREINHWLQGFTYPNYGSVIRDLLLAHDKQEIAKFDSSDEMQIALDRLKRTREMRAALTAIGLPVADAPAGEEVDG